MDNTWRDFLFDYWWLLLIFMWFIYAAYCRSLRYRQHKDTLGLLSTYAEQGKELPPELAKALGNGNGDDGRWAARSYRYGPHWEMRRVILFAAIAAGFSFAYYQYPAGNEPFGIVAIIMGALTVGYLLIVLMLPKPDGK